MIDATQIGNRLRMARKQRGLSQQAVADALGLSRTAVTNMESGSRAVSTLELTKLAATLGYSAAFFLGANEEPEAEDLSVALRRALPEMKRAPEVETAVRRLLDLCREGTGLRRMLDQKAERVAPTYAARMTNVADAIRQGEAVAQEERRRLGLGDAPIPNIAGLISEQGIWTAATNLPDNLSGLFVNHPTVGLAILVNREHWLVSRRFSYSREYAHALFDHKGAVTATREDGSSDLMEIRANAFAVAFLLPADGISRKLKHLDKGHPSRRAHVIFNEASHSATRAEIRARPGSQAIAPTDVALLAHRFGVSLEATIWRLKNLNHTSARETADLIELSGVGYMYLKIVGLQRLFEEGVSPEESERELRSQFLSLVIEAFRQEEISRGRLIELGRKLAINEDELIDLTETPHLDD